MTSPSNNLPIAIIGASSMVGSRFCELFTKRKLIKSDLGGKISVDIISQTSVAKFFENFNFEWIIQFSAYTNVDAAEKQRGDKKGSCWQINVQGTKNIVNFCQKFKKKLIFLSTDFVFDGTNGPYDEDKPKGPDFNKISWYGITKIEAEDEILRKSSDSIILRIAYPYRGKFKDKDDIVKRILRLYRHGTLYPLFTDQIITPTFIDDLSPAIDLLIDQKQKGIFHLVSPKSTTQYNFAKYLINLFKGDSSKLKKGSVRHYLENLNVTPRPIKGGLNVEKIKKLGFIPTDWQSGLEIIKRQSQGQLI